MNKFMNFVIDNNKLLKKIFDIFLAVILSFVGVISIRNKQKGKFICLK